MYTKYTPTSFYEFVANLLGKDANMVLSTKLSCMNPVSQLLVSIIVPCRNEQKYIGKFLDSLILQDYPKNRLEILIADGMSKDGTRETIAQYQKQHPYITILDNSKKYTPSALNIAIASAKGDIIIRMDSHARYENNYVTKCVNSLQEYQADNVGGIMKTIPSVPTLEARAIALCMSHGLGVGNSYFRKGSPVARVVDTVFGGCYRKEIFKKIGLFDERLVRSQDLDFNLRLKKAGGKIMLVPDIVSYYYPKSTFKEFWRHTFGDGIWALLPLFITRSFFKLRHYVPLFAISMLLLLLVFSFFSKAMLALLLFVVIIYFVLVYFSSLRIAASQKDVRLLVYMPIAFMIRNIAYGLGSFVGALIALRSFILQRAEVR